GRPADGAGRHGELRCPGRARRRHAQRVAAGPARRGLHRRRPGNPRRRPHPRRPADRAGENRTRGGSPRESLGRFGVTNTPETPAAPLIDLQRLFIAIRRRKRFWLATALLGLIAGAALAVVLPAPPTAVAKVI